MLAVLKTISSGVNVPRTPQ